MSTLHQIVVILTKVIVVALWLSVPILSDHQVPGKEAAVVLMWSIIGIPFYLLLFYGIPDALNRARSYRIVKKDGKYHNQIYSWGEWLESKPFKTHDEAVKDLTKELNKSFGDKKLGTRP